MEFEIAFSDAGGPADVEIAVIGVPTAAEFAKLNEQLLGDPRFRAGLRMLVDCSALDASPLSAEDVQRLTEPMVIRDWHFPPLAVALLAPDDRTFRRRPGLPRPPSSFEPPQPTPLSSGGGLGADAAAWLPTEAECRMYFADLAVVDELDGVAAAGE